MRSPMMPRPWSITCAAPDLPGTWMGIAFNESKVIAKKPMVNPRMVPFDQLLVDVSQVRKRGIEFRM